MSIDKHKASEQEFVAQVREALDDSVERIDAETRHKIITARHQALAQKKQITFFASYWSRAAIATALSIVVVVLIVKTQLPNLLESGSIQETNIESMELMAAQDTLDMYEELEFYTWLAEEDVTT